MGNTSSSPTGSASLKDTTLRSVLFGRSQLEVTPNAEGSMILKDQVDSTLFNSYIHCLKFMAQLSRLIYCDSGIIREVMLSPEFATDDNKSVNSKITEVDNYYLSMRKQPSNLPNSKEGRPMLSYVNPQTTKTGDGIATYISSPSDLTFMIFKGSQVSSKLPSLKDTDLLITFKGSSTIKNFKHDIYSQLTPADLSTLLPPGTTTESLGNVPASFVRPLLKSWAVLSDQIKKHNPTRLFVTGHSLGGAYATMFSFMMCELKASFPSISSIHLVTFGCPTLLADKARNNFNKHLDSGYITLDRVVSSGATSKIIDLIPTIPVGFSHPGFQPLRTEFFPERKTGRAYNLDNIRKVFQTGGVLGIGDEKNKYEIDTKTHMPNKVEIPAYTVAGNTFAHSEYFDMTWINSFRIFGMKNPGFGGNTFMAELYSDGIGFKYVSADPTEEEVPDPVDQDMDITKAKGSNRKTYRKRAKKFNKGKTRKNK